jgi:hypothetical protein
MGQTLRDLKIKVGGISMTLILGILNMLLILFQISSGLRWIKVPLGVHKRTGILLFFSAALHAFLAFYANYG